MRTWNAVADAYERVIATLSRGELAFGWHERGDTLPTLCVMPPEEHGIRTPATQYESSGHAAHAPHEYT